MVMLTTLVCRDDNTWA